MANSAAPLVSLGFKVPAPLLEELDEQCAALNANRATITRYAVTLGLAEVKRQAAELHDPTDTPEPGDSHDEDAGNDYAHPTRKLLIALRVDESEHSELHTTAAARGITLSEFLRRALVANGVALRDTPQVPAPGCPK